MHFFRKWGKIVKIAAVICEYNPLHLGHIRQFRAIRDALGEDTRIICLMSGSYVQRGAPAVFSAPERAQAAVLCGADLVLELPLTASLSSAEGFAAEAVEILDRLGVVDVLCFGCESGDGNLIMSTASLLRCEEFQAALSQAPEGMRDFIKLFAASIRRMEIPDRTAHLAQEHAWEAHCGEEAYLTYFDLQCYGEQTVQLPKDKTYRAELIDVWNMTREVIAENLSGETKLTLPGRDNLALLITRMA